jgi:hypothetical protein
MSSRECAGRRVPLPSPTAIGVGTMLDTASIADSPGLMMARLSE